jgi:hypothetical protein
MFDDVERRKQIVLRWFWKLCYFLPLRNFGQAGGLSFHVHLGLLILQNSYNSNYWLIVWYA